MILTRAQNTALKIMAELLPFCEKIEIAGSVRRERNVVNDIDLVILPKPGAIPKIKERCARNMNIFAGRRPDPNNVTFVNDKTGLQLDLFFAHSEIVDLVSRVPTNWGAVYLCRTGSKEHNQQLCIHAHTRGLKFAPYRGVVKKVKALRMPGVFLDGDFGEEIVASKSEEEIYEALGLKWREPRERETLNV